MDQVTLAKNQMRAENWRSFISACQQSGQTVVNWCEENNINTKTYYYWLRKLRKMELSEKELPVAIQETKPVVFKQLEVKPPLEGTRAAVIIHLPAATIESVYLPKNHFIKEESLSTENYLSYFYPFDKPDFKKNVIESGWSVTDREGIASAMAMGNAPQAVAMELQKEYAERYDWLMKEFTDLAFTFMTSFLCYMDYDTIDEQTRDLYRQGISDFGGISPTYWIALEKDAPVIVWDFHSLLVMAQMCFSFMLTDKDSDMRMCKHCKKTFVASRKGNKFCSQKCKNQFNVYKSREKKKGNKRND